MKTAFHVIDYFVAEFATKEQLTLLDEPIIAAVLSLYRFLMQSSRLIVIMNEALEKSCCFMLFLLVIV